jgi:hypothetical protein
MQAGGACKINIYKVGPNMQLHLQLGDSTSGRACSSVAPLGGIIGALSLDSLPVVAYSVQLRWAGSGSSLSSGR